MEKSGASSRKMAITGFSKKMLGHTVSPDEVIIAIHRAEAASQLPNLCLYVFQWSQMCAPKKMLKSTGLLQVGV
jgi:hypothetical protein